MAKAKPYPATDSEASLLYNKELCEFLDRVLKAQHIPVYRRIIGESIKRLLADKREYR